MVLAVYKGLADVSYGNNDPKRRSDCLKINAECQNVSNPDRCEAVAAIYRCRDNAAKRMGYSIAL